MLDRDDIVAAVHLGPPRANRKPVLRMMDVRGQPIAFAKLGINDLTCARIRHESAALSALESIQPSPLVTPSLIDVGVWNGLDYLIMRPVGNDSTRTPARTQRLQGTRELRSAFPTTTTVLGHASWWTRVHAALEESDDSAEARRLSHAAHRLRDRYGALEMELGAGHGDWSRWNMSADDAALVVWDWERFATDVPAGWDELHFVIGSHPQGVAAALADPDLLLREALPEVPRDYAWVLLGTYLVQRGAAYLSDRQFEAGARTGALGAWLLPALEQVVDRDTKQ
ncbi:MULTISPECIES: hypothetical protein [Bacteria]